MFMIDSSLLPVFIVNDTRVDGHFGCYAVMAAISQLAKANNFNVLGYWPAHKAWSDDFAYKTKIDQSKLVVINGEGTMHDDRPAAFNLLKIALYAKRLSIPVVLINASIENMSSDFFKKLSILNMISVRDKNSLLLLERNGLDARYAPDLSIFGVRNLSNEFVHRRGIGVTDSVLVEKSLDLFRLCNSVNGTHISIHDKNFFDPMNFLRISISLRRDIVTPVKAIRIAKARMCLWRSSPSSLHTFVRQIRGLSLLVSGRYHACTLALSSLTPFLGISSNTSKISSIIQDAQIENWRMVTKTSDLDCLNPQDCQWSSRELQAILDYRLFAIDKAKSLFCDLKSTFA